MNSSTDIWSEVDQVKREKRHELVLSGAEISKKIGACGLDNNIFSLDNLNFLNINQTCLKIVPDEIGMLENLTTLVLHSNAISTLPKTISNLKKLKVLDCSRNALDSLPQELSLLPQLTTINFGSNLLSEIPCQLQNTKLISIDLSNNKFQAFPDVCYAELIHLMEINLKGNEIKELPSSISVLSSLKHLNLSDNCISVVPGELAHCQKLKELNLKGNNLSDKRLYKLVDQCKTKQVLDYVRQHCPTMTVNSSNDGKGTKKGKRTQKNSESDITKQTIDSLTHKLRILRTTDSSPVIKILDPVKSVRPHIIACVVRNLTFNEDNFKTFIRLQTKLHEGICEKRNLATLATHDLDLIPPGDLTYTAIPPKQLKLQPLGRNKLYTAANLFEQLKTEADNLRREKKRNVYSGIHKYLYLIEGKPQFPCLLDSSNQVISLPPITNSDITKMSVNTKNMFVEVTNGTSQQTCRHIMDTFLKELVTLGISSPQCNDSEEKTLLYDLQIEQVKVVDVDGNLKHVYPSRNDFNTDDKSVTVIRD
ncbi:hypothetical protein PV327_007039 [Microctonus hyperodae]|uniref:B3/B4 tRNA-binding domain-containing protein n=1 Tax=Microctonus hyperodae TaxID=165561 RepID=A0AA39F5M4_MICHY|nr:hypothetical protein PV327_007039 [Microctonus hyperodae]